MLAKKMLLVLASSGIISGSGAGIYYGILRENNEEEKINTDTHQGAKGEQIPKTTGAEPEVVIGKTVPENLQPE